MTPLSRPATSAATRRDVERYTCASKVAHVSERIAQQRAEHRAQECGRPIYTYRCRWCKRWHLTSVPQR